MKPVSGGGLLAISRLVDGGEVPQFGDHAVELGGGQDVGFVAHWWLPPGLARRGCRYRPVVLAGCNVRSAVRFAPATSRP